MSRDNDKELIKAILAGNQQAFNEFISRYKKLVQYLVARMISNSVDREDVGQDIFIKIYHNLANFHFACKVSTWVAKIAHNTCINYLQKKKIPLLEDITSHGEEESVYWERTKSSALSPYEQLEQADTVGILQKEIDKLPVHYRSALTLFHLEEMSYTEIGEIMSLPEGTVKSYLFRARQILRHRLTKVIAEEAV